MLQTVKTLISRKIKIFWADQDLDSNGHENQDPDPDLNEQENQDLDPDQTNVGSDLQHWEKNM